jgi:hypothetical protein
MSKEDKPADDLKRYRPPAPGLEDLNLVVAFVAIGLYYVVHGLLTGKWITGFGVVLAILAYVGIGRITNAMKG